MATLNDEKDSRPSHIESAEDVSQTKEVHPDMKLDAHGLPLIPQPSDHEDDPLNWPQWYKYYVLSVLCLLAFITQFGAGSVAAGINPIAKQFKVSHQKAGYLTTTYTLFSGITPLLITPYVNLYGRRPAYLFLTMVAIASNIGSAYSTSFGGVIVSRIFAGVGSVALAIGAATICDMFFQGERGRFMGIYALAVTNGPHFGPIAGGFVALKGWQWIFKLNAILLAPVLALCIFTFPETLYSREESNNLDKRSFWSKMVFQGKVLNGKVTLKDFTYNVKIMKYWAVLLPCIYYATTNTYGSILFVLTTSTISEDLYHFNTAQNGLLIGVPLTIGCLIGESCTGWISDVLVNRYARRHGGYRKPEARLQLAFLALFLPAGLIITGVCAQKRTPWIGLAAGMVVASIGVQAGTTLTYAYCTDCYKPQAAEVSTMINLSRQVYAFTIGFYALPFAHRVGYGTAWGVLASINFLLWLPIIFLMWKGEEIRKRQGVPDWHKDL